MFICGITTISIAYGYDHLRIIPKKFLNALIIFSILFSLFSTISQLIPHQKEAINYYLSHKKLPVYNYYLWEYGDLAEAWRWLDEKTRPGTVIAYNYPELITPLYGTKLKNNIIYVNTSGTVYENALKAENFEGWFNKLRNYNVSYLYIFLPRWNPNAGLIEEIWVKEHAEFFIKEREWPYGFWGKAAIYRLKK